ncbi:DUF5610 domain-containing protein [Chromobacterium alticapitis]|uniref:DUF5610 domain-containing protein n=1 Tax=Chromobacterium alticapitis TaxID=2073169 RepID=A0A2S5DIA1_9NEIS|nr:DUF5610 domain-containing protein [Chromobacterium alticapitis]POZ62816.1 hypothetical protein C2I19_06590 [Chromobacterium alticapitis]
MSISSLNNAAANQTGQSSGAAKTQASAYNDQTARNQLNATLVQSLDVESLSVSISSGKQSQSLLFKASITNINQILSADFANANGQDGSQTNASASLQYSSVQLSISVQQQDASQGAPADDSSPDATSKRILDGALGMFGLYQQQHPDQNTADQAQGFLKLIRQGFDQGYQEATGILKSLNVLNGDVADGVQKTHDLVEKGFDDFLKQYQDNSGATAASAQSSGG